MILNWFFKDSSEGDRKISREDERRIAAQFKEWSPRILGIPEVQETITFDEVISYFQSDRPSSSSVKKGAIIRQERPEGQLLGQVFLDGNNQLVRRGDGTPYGRQLVTKNLDKKLKETFGDRELIFVELKTQNVAGDKFSGDAFLQFGEALRDILRLPEVVPVMTYDEAIKYFISDRPNDPRIKKGALLRKRHPQGYHLVQVFLDKNNELVCDSGDRPYGRQLVVRELDEELRDTFDDKDLIIVT